MRPDPAPPARLVGWPVAEPHFQGRQEAGGVRRSAVKHWGGGREAPRSALPVEERSREEVPCPPTVQEPGMIVREVLERSSPVLH